MNHQAITKLTVSTTVNRIAAAAATGVLDNRAGCGVGENIIVSSATKMVITTTTKQQRTLLTAVNQIISSVGGTSNKIKDAITEAQAFNRHKRVKTAGES